MLRDTARQRGLGRPLGLANGLSRLIWLYGGTDKLTHDYVRHYERHLGPRRLRRQTVFEIGVGGYESVEPGGSLAVWRDYLLRSTIVGIDIADKAVVLGDRVRFEQADQSSVDDLARVVATHGAPDVVIDDGSHVGGHIRAGQGPPTCSQPGWRRAASLTRGRGVAAALRANGVGSSAGSSRLRRLEEVSARGRRRDPVSALQRNHQSRPLSRRRAPRVIGVDDDSHLGSCS